MAPRPRTEKDVDIGWHHGKMVGNNHRHVICNYCGKDMHGGVTRLKEHLAGVIGDVSRCTEVPNEVRDQIKTHIKAKKKDKHATQLAKQRLQEELMSGLHEDSDDDSDEIDDEQREFKKAMLASRQSFREAEVDRTNRRAGIGSSKIFRRSESVRHRGEDRHSRGFSAKPIDFRMPSSASFEPQQVGPMDSFMQTKKGKTQPNIKAAMKGIKDVKKYVGRAISKFFYHNHIPFNAAKSPYYQNMVDAIGEAGRGVKPPTPYEISNTYLEIEKDETQKYIDTFGKFWDEYGCTIMCDGWSTQNRRKIINFLVYSTFGTVFLKSINATDKYQNAKYICDLMDSVVKQIGENRVVQVVTDNGANFKAAGKLLMKTRKHLYWTPCAAHCIDLIFTDMSKEEDVKSIILQSQMLTGFIYNHGWLYSLMRRETRNKELIRPAITRFATHSIALSSIYEHRDDLRRMIASREWTEKFSKLPLKDKNTGSEVYRLIRSEEFWRDIASLLIVFEPLVKVLRMVDSDDKAEMEYLYEAMDRAKEAIKKGVGKGYRRWWAMIDKRWEKQLHQDIHAAGYFLNPRYQYSNTVNNDDEVLRGLRQVIRRLEPSVSKQIQIDKEAEMYRMRSGVFATEKATTAIKQLTPAEWWSIIGREDAPNLTRLAIRILSQTVSSSNCERNWTTFSLIHTQTRNRLTMQKLEDLVFVHYNMRLRERNIQRKGNDEHIINLDNIFHEDDPLVEWIREREDALLDDRDNEWLDSTLAEGSPLHSDSPRQTENPVRSRKGKEISTSHIEEDDQSDSDNSNNSGDSGNENIHISEHHTTEGGQEQHSRGYEASYDYNYPENQMDEPYPRTYARRTRNHGLYDQNQSDYSSGYASYDIHESNDANTHQDHHCPYDNLAASLFGSSQPQYHFPSYYQAPYENDNDEEHQQNDPPRHSLWY